MAGHGTNKTGNKKSNGRRAGIKTKGRAKQMPPTIAAKREQEKRERSRNNRY
ncbi:MAG: hypothetical protein WC819_03530 [Parcubacteria group bacterium]|jgi:hypothetical protein